jgi:hypothetical protein
VWAQFRIEGIEIIERCRICGTVKRYDLLLAAEACCDCTPSALAPVDLSLDYMRAIGSLLDRVAVLHDIPRRINT